MLYERTHTRDLSEMGGLATVTPWIAAAFLVATLSSIGLPGLNNFVGEFLVILGSFGADRVLGAVAVTGVVLAAIYMLWAYQRAFQGPGAERHRGLVDLLPREIAAVVPVVAVMLVLGVAPNLVLDRINPSSAGVVAWVRSVDVDQRGLPGGLRAKLPPPDDADVRRPRPGSAVGPGWALMPTPPIELGPILPELILVGVGVILLLLAGGSPCGRPRPVLLVLCLGGIAAAAVAASGCGTGTAAPRCSPGRSRPTGSGWSSG